MLTFLKLAMVRTTIESGRTLNVFVESYKATISPNLLNVLPRDYEDRIANIDVEVDDIGSTDVLYMDENIFNCLNYSFQTNNLHDLVNKAEIKCIGWNVVAGRL